MKIGIVVFSKTGNTLSVAEKVNDKIESSGHTVTIERITLTSGEDDMVINAIRFSPLPDLSAFDAIIFASPVRAFSLAPAMKAYFATLGTLSAKKTACFVTHYFPYNWMGANGAISQMTSLIKSKGGDVVATGIVDWSNRKRELQITALIEKMSGAFNSKDSSQIAATSL